MVFIFFNDVFVWFWYQGNNWLHGRGLGSVSFSPLFRFWKTLSVGVKHVVESLVKPSGPEISFVGRF